MKTTFFLGFGVSGAPIHLHLHFGHLAEAFIQSDLQ